MLNDVTSRNIAFWFRVAILLYVPSQTVVHNDVAATAARVLDHETLYRWGMLAETLGAVIFIGLSLALYALSPF